MGRTWRTRFSFFVLFCFQILVLARCIPSGRLEPALQANADKLWPFATNLGRAAAYIGHPLSSGCLTVLRFPSRSPLSDTFLRSGDARLTPRSPPPPPMLTGSELPKTIHQLITRSGCPTSQGLPGSYLHSRDRP